MGRLGEAWNINQRSNPQGAVYQITVFINIGYLGPGLNDNNGSTPHKQYPLQTDGGRAMGNIINGWEEGYGLN